MKKSTWLYGLVGSCVISMNLLCGCTVAPPRQTQDVCGIFQQYPKWYWAAQRSERKWGVPISVQMAIVHQESRFKAKAKPPREKLLGFIPWFRPSTAYGYTQALNQTWEEYEYDSGNDPANRKCFSDAVDFVGWYANKAHAQAGIAKNNAYALYLAYHEGVGGYRRKTYLQKPWLIRVARKVASQSRVYDRQLRQGHGRLPKKHWWNIF